MSIPLRSVRALARRVRSVPGLVLLAMACSCASTCARGASESYIREQSEHLLFHAPDAQLWSETRALLAEGGFELPPGPPPRGYTATSASRVDGVQVETRLMVRFDGALGGTHVEIRRVSRSHDTAGDGGVRMYGPDVDNELTWQLFQRVEPARAAAIEAEAQRRAANTYAAWRGCERVIETLPSKPAAPAPAPSTPPPAP